MYPHEGSHSHHLQRMGSTSTVYYSFENTIIVHYISVRVTTGRQIC